MVESVYVGRVVEGGGEWGGCVCVCGESCGGWGGCVCGEGGGGWWRVCMWGELWRVVESGVGVYVGRVVEGDGGWGGCVSYQ